MNDISSLEGWRSLLLFCLWTISHDFFTIAGLAGALYVAWKWPERKDERWKGILVFGLLLTLLMGVALARNTFFHYYLQMGLPLALAAGFALSKIEIRESDWTRISIVALVFLGVSAYSPYRFDGVDRHADQEKHSTLREVAQFLEVNTHQDETIFVLTGEPIIYFLADRKAPTRYFFWLYHWGRWLEVFNDLGIEAEDLFPKWPQWFVYQRRDERVPQLEKIMYENYELQKTIGSYELARLKVPRPIQ